MMNRRKTRNFSYFIWFILSISLLFLEKKNGINCILMTICGCLLGFIGIGQIFNSFHGWVIWNIGLGILLYPISKVFGYNFNYITNLKQVIITFCFLIAMQLFFDDYFRNKNAKKRCTIPFKAKCISFAQAGINTYIPIYRYHIDGKTNTFYGNNLSSVNPKLGDIITVFVNKKNENDVYCPTAKAILMIRYFIRINYS